MLAGKSEQVKRTVLEVLTTASLLLRVAIRRQDSIRKRAVIYQEGHDENQVR